MDDPKKATKKNFSLLLSLISQMFSINFLSLLLCGQCVFLLPVKQISPLGQKEEEMFENSGGFHSS